MFISCGKTGSNESYLKVLNTAPANLQQDVIASSTIVVNFNQKITNVNMALINTDKLSGETKGEIVISDKKATFIPEYGLSNNEYKVIIYKEGTTSPSKQLLKENYTFTFKVILTPVNEANTTNKKQEENTTKETNNNQSYSTCDLIPQMECDDIKKIEN